MTDLHEMQKNSEEYDRFLDLVLANHWNAIILDRFQGLGLKDWWLTAGCLSQSVWNGLYGREPDHGIIDYDIFYFDSDTSWESEDVVISRTNSIFSDLPISVQIRNQARVPLWYEKKFGVSYPPVNAAGDGIDRFPCKTVSTGIRRVDDKYEIYAPFGLGLLLSGILVPNTILQVPDAYTAKTNRWREVWTDLIVEPWPVQKDGVDIKNDDIDE